MSAEIDLIMNKYFAAMADKDADAFRLYEDNQRLRTLVEQTLEARQSLEAEHRATTLLVQSLQTTLAEKQYLVEAQDKEAVHLREGIAALRVLLRMPSELDSSMGEVVEAVEGLLREGDALRRGVQYAQWCCTEWEQWALESIVEEEQAARAALVDAYAGSVYNCSGMKELVLNALDADALQRRELAELRAQQTTLQQQWKLEEQRLSKDVQSAQLEALQGSYHDVRVEKSKWLGQLHELANHLEEALYCLHGAERTITLLVDRCHAAEEQWGRTLLHLRERTKQCVAAECDKIETQRRLERLAEAQEEDRGRVLRLKRQAANAALAREEVEELQTTLATSRSDLQALREKYVQLAEKERHGRTQHTAALAALQEVQEEKERRISKLEAMVTRHESSLQTAEASKKSLLRQNTHLQRRVEELEEVHETLHHTTAELQDVKARLGSAEAQLHSKETQHQQSLQDKDDEHHRALDAAEQRFLELQQQHEKQLLDLRETHKQEQRSMVQDHAQSIAPLKEEVKEWAAIVDAHKSEVRVLRDSLHREQTARSLLEDQHRSESVMMHRALEDKSYREEKQRVPLEAMAAQVKRMESRQQLMEEACRRSAEVIARLREQLHVERTERRLLENSRMSETTPYSKIHSTPFT